MISVSVPAGVLRRAFAVLGKLIPNRTTLPVLGAIRIERVENRILLTATDLDRWLTFTHLAEPEPITELARTLAALRWPRQSGTVLVPKSALRDAIHAVDENGSVTFSSDGPDASAVHIGYLLNGSLVSLPIEAWPPSDFPEIPAVKSARSCILDVDARAAIVEADQFSSTEATRYVLNGVYLETRHDDHVCTPIVVATDGRRLYRRAVPALAPLRSNLILPSGIVDLLSQPALLGHDWKFDTDRKAERVTITAGPWILVGKTIEGNFPNYRQVIPSEADATVALRSPLHRQFVQVLGKLPTPTKKAGSESITLRFQRDRLGIECPHTKASVIVPGVTCTRPKSISLNRVYLRELLATGPGTFRLIDELSPIRYDTTRNAVHVLMPMRAT